jgi:hypothetical protein
LQKLKLPFDIALIAHEEQSYPVCGAVAKVCGSCSVGDTTTHDAAVSGAGDIIARIELANMRVERTFSPFRVRRKGEIAEIIVRLARARSAHKRRAILKPPYDESSG